MQDNNTFQEINIENLLVDILHQSELLISWNSHPLLSKIAVHHIHCSDEYMVNITKKVLQNRIEEKNQNINIFDLNLEYDSFIKEDNNFNILKLKDFFKNIPINISKDEYLKIKNKEFIFPINIYKMCYDDFELCLNIIKLFFNKKEENHILFTNPVYDNIFHFNIIALCVILLSDEQYTFPKHIWIIDDISKISEKNLHETFNKLINIYAPFYEEFEITMPLATTIQKSVNAIIHEDYHEKIVDFIISLNLENNKILSYIHFENIFKKFFSNIKIIEIITCKKEFNEIESFCHYNFLKFHEIAEKRNLELEEKPLLRYLCMCSFWIVPHVTEFPFISNVIKNPLNEMEKVISFRFAKFFNHEIKEKLWKELLELKDEKLFTHFAAGWIMTLWRATPQKIVEGSETFLKYLPQFKTYSAFWENLFYLEKYSVTGVEEYAEHFEKVKDFFIKNKLELPNLFPGFIAEIGDCCQFLNSHFDIHDIGWFKFLDFKMRLKYTSIRALKVHISQLAYLYRLDKKYSMSLDYYKIISTIKVPKDGHDDFIGKSEKLETEIYSGFINSPKNQETLEYLSGNHEEDPLIWFQRTERFLIAWFYLGKHFTKYIREHQKILLENTSLHQLHLGRHLLLQKIFHHKNESLIKLYKNSNTTYDAIYKKILLNEDIESDINSLTEGVFISMFIPSLNKYFLENFFHILFNSWKNQDDLNLFINGIYPLVAFNLLKKCDENTQEHFLKTIIYFLSQNINSNFDEKLISICFSLVFNSEEISLYMKNYKNTKITLDQSICFENIEDLKENICTETDIEQSFSIKKCEKYMMFASSSKDIHIKIINKNKNFEHILNHFIIISMEYLKIRSLRWRNYLLWQQTQKNAEKMAENALELSKLLEEERLKLKEANLNLKELDKAKSIFFSNISHELRTPLTISLSLFEQMMHEDIPQSLKNLSKQGLYSQRILLKLIDSLMDKVKLESGKLGCHLESFSLHQNLKSILDLFQYQSQKLNINIHLEGNDSIIQFDPMHFERVIFNILSNSLKFTPSGGDIFFQLSCHEKKARLIIRDTGKGMDEYQLQNLFERFTESQKAISLQQAGTGLGMSFVKELMKINHGEIMVESSLEKGTTFFLDFMMIEAKELITEVKTSSLIINSHISKKPYPIREHVPHIMIVDDTFEILEHLANILKPHYNVWLCEDGSVAWQTLLDNPSLFSCIISDYMMPRMNGIELLQKVREYYDIYQLPFLLLTARSDDEARLEAFEHKVNDFMQKPFSQHEVLLRIGNLIEAYYLHKIREKSFAMMHLGELALTLGDKLNTPLQILLLQLEDWENENISQEILTTLQKQFHKMEEVVQDLKTFHPFALEVKNIQTINDIYKRLKD